MKVCVSVKSISLAGSIGGSWGWCSTIYTCVYLIEMVACSLKTGIVLWITGVFVLLCNRKLTYCDFVSLPHLVLGWIFLPNCLQFLAGYKKFADKIFKQSEDMFERVYTCV